MSEFIQQIVQVFKEQVVQDIVVLRNIRRVVEQVIEVFFDESCDLVVRVVDVIVIFEEISEDLNMLMYMRIIIWEVFGVFEQVK